MRNDFQDNDRVFATAGHGRFHGMVRRIDTEDRHTGLVLRDNAGQFLRVRHIHTEERQVTWVVWDVGSHLPEGPFAIRPVEERTATAA